MDLKPKPNLPVLTPEDARFPARQDFVVALPTWLDGSEGANRNRQTQCQFEGDTDLEAIEAWLKTKRRRSPHTLRSYRREAYRLLAWSVAFRQRPLSNLTIEDVEAFHQWLQAPVSHPLWDERGWELFRGPLSPGSQRQALVILGGLCSWLVDAGYLVGNPFRLYDSGAIAQEQAEEKESEQERFLPLEIWRWVQAHLDKLAPPNNRGGAATAYERKRFIVTFLYWTGLRRSELATATMARFQKQGDTWTLKVKGKGRNKLEAIAVLDPAMDALRRYRIYRGLPENPSSEEADVPVVASADGSAPISDHYLNTLLKSFFSEAAGKLETENPDWAKLLRNATAHWMRHTLATHSAEAGVPIEVTANQLRHRSMDTTRRIYTHVRARHQRKEMMKLEELMGEEPSE